MGRKLLVADDSVTIQKVIKLALSSEGYEIVGVSGGHEALQVIQGESPALVLVDVSLPDMNAYDLKRKINEGGAGSGGRPVKFVLMYSAFEKIDEKQAESLGFSGRLIKPFDPSNLRKLVADLMNQAEAPEPVASPEPVVSPPAPPQEDTPLPPPPPRQQEAAANDDLPPMEDMHPILHGEPAPEKLSPSSEISLDLPLGQQDLSGSHTIDIPILSEERTRFTEFHQPAHASPPPEAAPEGLFAVPPEPRMDANDIRKLTDSTIQMTGLDLGGWSVDDSRKMKGGGGASAPLPREAGIPRRIDDGGSTFLSDIAARPAQREEPALQVPRPGLKAPGRPAAPTQAPAQTSPYRPEPSASQGAGDLPLDQIEQIVRRDLEKMLRPMLEKAIRDTVPTIAESIIKKEIERLLSEP